MHNDETLQHHNHGDYEREDLSTRSVFVFLAGLALLGIVVYFVIAGVYSYLDRYAAQHQPRQNPLVPAAQGDTRAASDQDARKFPTPRLESNERWDLDDIRTQEEQTLNSFGWVNEKTGVARIPIARAMELTVQRGLPLLPQNGAALSPPSAGSQSMKAKKK